MLDRQAWAVARQGIRVMEIIAAYWIEILTALVVLAALLVLFLRGRPKVSGADAVKTELDRLGDEYTVLDNVLVPTERGMFRIPHLILSPYGVFVVTVRDLTGKIYGHEGEDEWFIKSGRIRDTMRNPLWENRKHINALEKKIGSYPFVPVVVFTHAKLVDDFGDSVLRIRQLQKFFIAHRKTTMSLEQINKVVDKLEGSD